jgi:YVTN family beta-propeller protein
MPKLINIRFWCLCASLIAAIVFAGCAGPAGLSGPPGPAGPVGLAGPAGPAGPAGMVAPAYKPLVIANTTFVPLIRTPILSVTGRALSSGIMDIDQQAHRLYLADKTAEGVDVFDISMKQPVFLGVLPTFSPPSGVAVAKKVNKLYASLANHTIVVFDIDPVSANFNSIIATVTAGGTSKSAEMDYDPVDNKVYVANSDALVTVIDGTTDKMIKQFTGLGVSLVQSRYNVRDGFMYMVSGAQNVIFQFDPKTDVLIKKMDIVDDASPHGLAINPKTNVGLLGNTSFPQHLTFWDFNSQKVKSTSDVAGGADMTAYDSVAELFFAACDSEVGPVMAIFNGSDEKFITYVPTAPGAKKVAYDQTNRMVYTVDSTLFFGALVGFPWPYKK